MWFWRNEKINEGRIESKLMLAYAEQQTIGDSSSNIVNR